VKYLKGVIMSVAFISYSHKDIDFVYKLNDALKNSGREIKGDWDIIPPEEWKKAISTGIEEADNFICVLMSRVPCFRNL
jgi:TIR domain